LIKKSNSKVKSRIRIKDKKYKNAQLNLDFIEKVIIIVMERIPVRMRQKK
jgi:hypothetical protein